MKLKKIKPLFNSIITTVNKYSVEETNDLVTEKEGKQAMKEYQTVLAVGPMVKDVKVGDVIMINPKAYEVRKFRDGSIKNNIINQEEIIGYNFKYIETEQGLLLMITDRDIEFIIEEFEE